MFLPAQPIPRPPSMQPPPMQQPMQLSPMPMPQVAPMPQPHALAGGGADGTPLAAALGGLHLGLPPPQPAVPRLRHFLDTSQTLPCSHLLPPPQAAVPAGPAGPAPPAGPADASVLAPATSAKEGVAACRPRVSLLAALCAGDRGGGRWDLVQLRRRGRGGRGGGGGGGRPGAVAAAARSFGAQRVQGGVNKEVFKKCPGSV